MLVCLRWIFCDTPKCIRNRTFNNEHIKTIIAQLKYTKSKFYDGHVNEDIPHLPLY